MKHRFMLPTITAVLSITCLILMYFFHSPAAYVLLALCLVGLLSGYIANLHKQADAERKSLLESLQKTASATLSHHRHDWMNDLQVLYGYIQLGKYDKLAGCVGRIKERMAADSRISRLGIPSLVFFLHSFREMNSSMQLDIQIEEDLELGGLLTAEDAEQFAEAVIATIRAYQFMGRSSWDEMMQLQVSIYRDHDEIMAVFNREDGHADMTAGLQRHVDTWNNGKRVLVEQLDSKLSSLRLRVVCAN